jgi:hypothetical protein
MLTKCIIDNTIRFYNHTKEQMWKYLTWFTMCQISHKAEKMGIQPHYVISKKITRMFSFLALEKEFIFGKKGIHFYENPFYEPVLSKPHTFQMAVCYEIQRHMEGIAGSWQ